MRLGQRIKKMRKLRGYTQRKLAVKAGLNEITIQFYEYGTRRPKAEQLHKLADALEVDVSFLMPRGLDTPAAFYSLLFDLVEQCGDVVMEERNGAVLFGVRDGSVNAALRTALEKHKNLPPEEFQAFLAKNTNDK